MAQSRSVLVTGGSGFVGTNLVDFFLRQGMDVSNFDILPPSNHEHMAVWKEVDIRDKERLVNEMKLLRPAIIVHCAARTDMDEKQNLDGYDTNIDGVCHLVDAIRSAGTVQRVIFFSSQLVCRLGYKPKDPDDYQPSTLYGRSKAIGEKIVKATSEFGPTWTIVRPTSLWGPWFDIPYRSFFEAIAHGLYIHPKGVRTLKQWGFIGNTVYQVQRLLEAPKQSVHGKTFYMADYDPIELKTFADQVRLAFDAPPIHSVPLDMLKAAARIGDVCQRLGWNNPPLTSFRLGNILANEIQDLGPLSQIAKQPPFDILQGIEITTKWIRSN